MEEKTQGPRIIYMSGGLDAGLGDMIISQLTAMSIADSASPIVMHIDSFGGRADYCLNIIDKMNSIPNPIHTVCFGKAMSAGGFILASGEKGTRSIAPNARVMLHQPNGGAILDGKDTDYELNNLLRSRIGEIIAEVTGKSKAVVDELMINDLYFSAQEALEFGLVDEIL